MMSLCALMMAVTLAIGEVNDKKLEEFKKRSQEFNESMEKIDRQREESGQNAMLEKAKAWKKQQEREQRIQKERYAVFESMSADWGIEDIEGFVFYELPEEYAKSGYFPEKMQIYTRCLCKQYDVPYALILAMIERESGYVHDRIGDDGESKGYMQIYEKWHVDRMEKLACTDLMNPYQNVRVGIDYFSELYQKYGTIQDALAAYNYGEKSVKEQLWSKGVYVYSYNSEIMQRMKEIEEEVGE